MKWITLALVLHSGMPCQAENPVVATAHLAGNPVYQDELDLHTARQRAMVAVHFKERHGVTLDNETAWRSSFDGEVPEQMLSRNAMRACLRDKAIQILAAKHGVGRILPFPGFAAHVESTNQQRRAALVNGAQIHGPVRFTAWQLYRYEIDNMRIRLTQVLAPGASNDTGPDKVESAIREMLEPVRQKDKETVKR